LKVLFAKVTERLEVVRKDGAVIPGLYAACSVGRSGLLLEAHGHHLGWAFIAGRIAGRNAAFDMQIGMKQIQKITPPRRKTCTHLQRHHSYGLYCLVRARPQRNRRKMPPITRSDRSASL
jgi:hypothetical protein